MLLYTFCSVSVFSLETLEMCLSISLSNPLIYCKMALYFYLYFAIGYLIYIFNVFLAEYWRRYIPLLLDDVVDFSPLTRSNLILEADLKLLLLFIFSWTLKWLDFSSFGLIELWFPKFIYLRKLNFLIFCSLLYI